MQTHRRAVLFLVLTSALWSLGGVLIKQVDWNPLAIAGGRSAVAAATIWLLTGRRRPALGPLQLLTALFYAGTVISFVAANKLTTAANAIFLQFTAPVYIALLGAWFLREHPTRLDWALIAVTLGGIALFFVEQLSLAGRWGNVCALASGVCWAGLVVLLRRQKDASPVDSVLLGNVLTALVCVPFAVNSEPGQGDWVWLVVLGVVQLGFPYFLYATAIKHVRALEASLIGSIEPVLNPVWVLLFIGEKPTPWAMAGGLVVVVAATVRGVVTARNAVDTRTVIPPGPD
jgi:drug/metabolite transporter (DMT)-like permease